MICDSPASIGDGRQAIWAATAALATGLPRELRNPLCAAEAGETGSPSAVMGFTLPAAQAVPVV